MARTPDKNSVRQRAFKMLDGMRRLHRKTAMAKITAKFALGKRYAETIYATHRQMGIDAGLYTTTYRVLDTYNGKSVLPYLSTHKAFKPKRDDFLTMEAAVDDYVYALKQKLDTVKKLTVDIPQRIR